MKIVINCFNNEYQEILSFEKHANFNEINKKFSSIKEPFEVKIFAINESISSHRLSILKKNIDNINLYTLCIYSNNRDTILAGRSIKINSTFFKEKVLKNKLLLFYT